MRFIGMLLRFRTRLVRLLGKMRCDQGTRCLSVTLVISDMKGHAVREAEPHPEINFGRTGLSCWECHVHNIECPAQSLECVKVLGASSQWQRSPGALLYWEWSGLRIEGPGGRENY
jgi:hypothetical protein